MTKSTTNVIGIIIVILAGIYFYISYCSACAGNDETAAVMFRNETKLIAFHLTLTEEKMAYNTFVDL